MSLKEEELERHITKNAIAIDELSIRIETLNTQADVLFEDLNVSLEQLTAFIENKEYFTEDNWKTLQEQRHILEEKLLRELANIRNPQKTKKAFKDLNVKPHWLFVR